MVASTIEQTPLADFAAAAAAAAAGGVQAAAEALADAVATVTRAQLVVARTVDPDGALRARAVHARSLTLAAEVEGSRLPADEVPTEERDETADVPAPLRRLADRAGAAYALIVPAVVDGRVLA